MQLSTLMMAIMITALLTPFTNSLISLGSLLLIMALMMTVLVSMAVNSWYAFILFLIYITGLLVLFSYMMAMSPNAFYTSKNKYKATIMVTMIMMVTTITMAKPLMVANSTKGSKMFEKEVIKLFEPMSIQMYWFIALVLLIALLMAVTICFKAAKPLRSFSP